MPAAGSCCSRGRTGSQDGSYKFDGRSHQLPLTEAEHANAIHGLVRWSAWTVANARRPRRDGAHPSAAARLPVLARAAYRVRVSAAGLSRAHRPRRTSARTVPVRVRRAPVPDPRERAVDPLVLTRAGPHGARDGRARHSDRSAPSPARTSTSGTEARSARRGSTTASPTSIGTPPAGPGRAARPRRRRRATLWVDDAYPYLMVFSGDPLPDADRRSVAVEPMTCPPNAFRSGEALIRLEPGGSFASRWGIAPALPA